MIACLNAERRLGIWIWGVFEVGNVGVDGGYVIGFGFGFGCDVSRWWVWEIYCSVVG